MTEPCLFCAIQTENRQRIVSENELAYAIRDGFPVTQGHTLVIPKRHALDYTNALWVTVDYVNFEGVRGVQLSRSRSFRARLSPGVEPIFIEDGSACVLVLPKCNGTSLDMAGLSKKHPYVIVRHAFFEGSPVR